jgi:hypothetical protein
MSVDGPGRVYIWLDPGGVFLERVPALRPRVVLEVPEVRHPRLMRWSEILARHGGGEGGHYFTE